LGAYDYTGGALTGHKQNPEMDEFERKEFLRKNRRRPIEETISELGEGRGMERCLEIRAWLTVVPRNLWARLRREKEREN
jgi:hypothetical protein